MIEVLIPTHKRKNDLLNNLFLLKKQILSDGLEKKVSIIISDNCSNDGTEKSVTDFISSNPEINTSYYKQQENIGLEKNAVFVLSKAKTEYVMFLGDDDFLPNGYIKFCLQEIEKDKMLGCIIPGNINTDPESGNTNIREAQFDYKIYPPGFNSMKEIGHYAHQMSGLLLKRESVLEKYLENHNRNLYLFIYFSLSSIHKYNSIFAPGFKVKINLTNKKVWEYDKAGFLCEVYKSYYPFIKTLGEEKTVELIYDFTRRQSFRFGIEPFKPIISLNRLNFLLNNTIALKGLKRKLIILYTKDYLYRLFPFVNPYKT